MIAYHVEKGADITVGVVEVPARESRDFGVLLGHRVESRHPLCREARAARLPCPVAPTASSPRWASTSSTRAARERCWRRTRPMRIRRTTSARTSCRRRSQNRCRCSPIRFSDVKTRAQNYWRDVGTVDAYYDANLELVHVRPELNIYDEDWPIWTYQVQQPPAKFILDEEGRRGMAVNSHGVRRLHHLRRRGARIAAVLDRARRGAQQHRALGDPAQRATSAATA